MNMNSWIKIFRQGFTSTLAGDLFTFGLLKTPPGRFLPATLTSDHFPGTVGDHKERTEGGQQQRKRPPKSIRQLWHLPAAQIRNWHQEYNNQEENQNDPQDVSVHCNNCTGFWRLLQAVFNSELPKVSTPFYAPVALHFICRAASIHLPNLHHSNPYKMPLQRD